MKRAAPQTTSNNNAKRHRATFKVKIPSCKEQTSPYILFINMRSRSDGTHCIEPIAFYPSTEDVRQVALETFTFDRPSHVPDDLFHHFCTVDSPNTNNCPRGKKMLWNFFSEFLGDFVSKKSFLTSAVTEANAVFEKAVGKIVWMDSIEFGSRFDYDVELDISGEGQWTEVKIRSIS